MTTGMTTAADIVAVARAQIGTRWVHQGRLPGVALDCVGLVVHVGRATGLVAPDFDVNGYSRAPDGDMLNQAGLHLVRIDGPELGAVIVLATEVEPQHVGIVADYRHGGWSIVHASNAGVARVVETRLMFTRAMALRGYFRFPGIV